MHKNVSLKANLGKPGNRKLGVTNMDWRLKLTFSPGISVLSHSNGQWAAILGEIGHEYGGILFGSDVGGIYE